MADGHENSTLPGGIGDADRVVQLEPLTVRERLVAFAFMGVFAGGLILGATRVVEWRYGFGAIGIALTVHGAALLLNVGRIRDRGLTMADLNVRFRQLCCRWLPLLRPFFLVNAWLEDWRSARSRIGPMRIIESALTLAFGVLFVALALFFHSPGALGSTGQGTLFALGGSHGRVRWLRTSLTASCVGGTTWKASWSPSEGAPVHFAMAGKSFSTHELSEPRYPDGTVGRVAFVMHGRATGPGSAEGTVRLVARFYSGAQETVACDSLDVPWAVGVGAASRVHYVRLGRVIDRYYPEVPSLAGRVSPARQHFIALVDATCVRTYNQGVSAERAVGRTLPGGIDSRLNPIYAGWHIRQLQALVRLGPPPDSAALYDGWLASFRRRVTLEGQALSLYKRGDLSAAQRLLDSIDLLAGSGHELGQQFGLVLCTSNGDRTPVPILSDDPTRPLP